MNQLTSFVKLLSFACLLALSFSAAAQKPVVLDPQRTVIYSQLHTDNILYATGTLQKWLRKIYRTNTGFERINEMRLEHTQMYPQTELRLKDKFVIAVGPTPFGGYRPIQEVGKYGFAIQRKGDVVSIVGAESPIKYKPIDQNNMMLGVAYFLDRYCGVRFYTPHDLFTSLPASGKVTIPATINVVEKPFTQYVMGTGLANTGNFREFQWARFNGYQRKDFESHQHSMGERFPPEKFAQKYPEIYPLFNGQRYIPKSAGDQQWQPDFADPTMLYAARFPGRAQSFINSALDRSAAGKVKAAQPAGAATK